MVIASRFSLLCAVLLAVAMACSEYNNDPVDPGTPTDRTPPGITAVTTIDAYDIEVVFNEGLNRTTAQDLDHYLLTENSTPPISSAWAATPGDTITIVSAVLLPDLKTVALHTSTTMASRNCDLAVEGVADTHGNEINEAVEKSFRASDDADATAPEIVRRFPAPGATGVAVGFPVRIQFSEPLNSHAFALSKAGSPVAVVLSQFDPTTWELKPVDLLEYDTEYTVDASASDGGNPMAPVQWTFRTTATIDETPPTLVSTAPSNLSAGAAVTANLSATFSEPMDQEYSQVALTPDPGDGTATWSEDGRTVTFNPDAALQDDQQYTFAIYPGDVRDLAGNEIERLYTIVFTTAGALEKGSIAGTLMGDPGTQAADPTGAVVIAGDAPFDPGPFNTFSSTVVAPNNTYNVLRLADAAYYLVAIKDTNHDGRLEPGSGDAVGAYGIDSWPGEPDSIAIVNGSHVTNRNFPLTDPTSVRGTVTYSGASAGGSFVTYVALFDTTGFDTLTVPTVTVQTAWPDTPAWEMLSLDQGFGDAVYYVRAFLDVNTNGTYEAATDPVGMYGGTGTPTPLNVTNGVDFKGVVVPLADPVVSGPTTVSVSWPAPRHNPAYQLIREIARRGLAGK